MLERREHRQGLTVGRAALGDLVEKVVEVDVARVRLQCLQNGIDVLLGDVCVQLMEAVIQPYVVDWLAIVAVEHDKYL